MEARTIAKQVAYGRIAIGAAMVVPDLVTRPWLGAVADTTGARVLSAGFGARDIAVGAGTAYALHTGGAARPWLLAAAFTDAVDLAATFATRRALPARRARPRRVLGRDGRRPPALWSARELAQPTP